MSASNTIMQTIVDESKRGRVMSFYTMAFIGVTPFGSLIAGMAASIIGASPYRHHRWCSVHVCRALVPEKAEGASSNHPAYLCRDGNPAGSRFWNPDSLSVANAPAITSSGCGSKLSKNVWVARPPLLSCTPCPNYECEILQDAYRYGLPRSILPNRGVSMRGLPSSDWRKGEAATIKKKTRQPTFVGGDGVVLVKRMHDFLTKPPRLRGCGRFAAS
jgi:hypothetical protein